MSSSQILERCKSVPFYSVLIVFCMLTFVLSYHFSDARFIRSYRDTLSSSAPNAYSNHTIEFTVDTAIPAGGYISIRPQAGEFTIPMSTFSFLNAEIAVSTGGPYATRPATTTADATYDGVTITTGSSGEVLLMLNSTAGIASGSNVRVTLGNNTTNASTTIDTGFLNPSTTGTKSIAIEAGGGTETATARALVAIIDQVTMTPINTRETVPPLRFNGAPSGLLSGTVTGVELSLNTNELATCRYSQASGTPYFSMNNLFTLTGQLTHTKTITGLGTSTYSYFVRCIDDENNINTDDYEITFTIPEPPTGTPGTGSSTGTGGGTGGSGSGSSGSGGGSSSGGGSGSGSGGSGGGGGSSSGNTGGTDGGGGFESTPGQYRSGDAQVIITGYAFPNSSVTVLVDGYVTDSQRANGSGVFTVTIDQIARGVYTFGVYALDAQGTKSSTFSTTFSVVGARTSNLSNINLMPTIRVTPNPVDPGATVVFSGSSIPNSTIDLETQRDKSSAAVKRYQANSNAAGVWSVNVPTTGFEQDTWKVKAKSTNASLAITTQFSNYTFYGVGAPVKKGLNSDLNRDGKVNLIDFSILLFHWNTAGGQSDPPADINQDGKVSLTDFSIMIFNWTG